VCWRRALVTDLRAQLHWNLARFNKSFMRLSHEESVLPHNRIGFTAAARALVEKMLKIGFHF
jgi:hypothetical protein